MMFAFTVPAVEVLAVKLTTGAATTVTVAVAVDVLPLTLVAINLMI